LPPNVIRFSSIFVTVAMAVVTGSACANEEDQATMARYTPHGPHRFDFSYTSVDTFDADVDLFLFGYTRAVRSNIVVGVTGGLTRLDAPADPATGRDTEIDEWGLSDTLVTFQFDPSEKLTTSPWIPDTVGINGSLLMPTGDTGSGLGGDAWLGSVGGGWLIDFFSHLWLAPAISYEASFAEGDAALSTEAIYASCDIIWVFPFGGWIGYSPSIGRDLEFDEWVDGHTLTIGKLWQKGLGLSLELGKDDHVSRVPVRDDERWLVNFYYQF
jgi:hypothetical protein